MYSVSRCVTVNTEEQLSRFLLSGYNAKARPVLDDKQAVNVTIDVGLHHIMKVNEKNEFLQSSVKIRQYWNDPRLRWNKTMYEGIERITIDPQQIWLPDISLFNSATSSIAITETQARVVIKHTGEIAWHNPAILVSSCIIDISMFPFDNQTCIWRMGSWSFHTSFLDVFPGKDTADLSDYVENGEWSLQSVIPYRLVKTYECCEGAYSEIRFEIKLRRRTLYYMMNFILPCILIAVLTLLVFLLPFESGERMSFGVTVLLSFTILILMLKNKLPPTSKAIPLIAVYYACTIIEVSLAMIVACLAMRIYCPEQLSPLPGWAKGILMNVCGKIVGLSGPIERVKQEMVIQRMRQEKLREQKPTTNPKITIITDNILDKEEAEATGEEWRLSSFVVNRLFSLIYLVTIIVTFLVVVML
ncbi:neuronal acetylcholine receptor subunit alpha-9-II isoform X2 [Exaiptasia diaphana]|uniref:Neuronal acetylcholine receptor subunit alpha-10-like n=1 Tax=Exaiptasia diaphana TaxID=2652724 RepID=A0A913YCR0_EXADI|nr:neuronal acetylcholine receptor subunit alpha-9-II isoform X2 [Exaiptasia diaphana]